MTPTPVMNLSETTVALCVISIFLIPLAGAGLSLISAGLGRARSSSHMMMASLCVVSVAAIVYFLFGFAWQGYAGSPGYELVIGAQGLELDWVRAIFLSQDGLAGQLFFLRLYLACSA